jgi:predicted GNAT family N-acyltransferase
VSPAAAGEHRVGAARFTLRRATLAEILALRHAVLRPGRPLLAAAFDGDDDADTRHFGAFDAAGANVGCLSFMRRPLAGEPAHQLRGMATRADLARCGLGAALLGVAVRAVRAESGIALFWCNARCEAADFYRRLGWTVRSAPFDVPDVGPHVVMVLG